MNLYSDEKIKSKMSENLEEVGVSMWHLGGNIVRSDRSLDGLYSVKLVDGAKEILEYWKDLCDIFSIPGLCSPRVRRSLGITSARSKNYSDDHISKSV